MGVELVGAQPAAPTRASQRRVVGQSLIEVVVVAVGYIVYALSCGMVRGHEPAAYAHAAGVIAFEHSLHLLAEQWLQGLILPHSWTVQVFNSVYMWGHLPLIIAVAVWLFAWHRREYRIIRNALLISGGIALIVFYLFPVAPPRLVPSLHIADTAALVSPVYDTVEPKVFFNPYAAIPSMHIGWDLLVGIGLIWCSDVAALRWFGLLLPLAMFFAVIVTGNHYIVDGFAGAAAGLAGLAAALWIEHLYFGRDVRSATPSAD